MFHLFPVSSLDNSILTSVLVGVLIVWWFQETLGWNFTGLVVPGYLASILVIQPETGFVVLGESVLTWLVFTTLSDRVPRWWPWSPLFGRDRFFGLLLVSVAVRILLEGGGFAWLQRSTGILVNTELHSMSLVVVPLAANAIWRTGFVASLTRLGVPVVLTWAFLDLVLLKFTNLSLSSFELTYEDLSLDFVSSPRAYILLLTGAWLGSSANLRWGWDYGGIIVPGLLAVCWLEPLRLVATLAEVAVIAFALKWTVRLPFFRTANLTGGRPLVLAFCLGYGIKFVLAWALGAWWPGLQVRELFGFGYLLSTMIALRVVRAGDDLFRPIVPSVVTSLAGTGLGSAIGYALAVVLPAPLPEMTASRVDARPELALATAAWEPVGDVPDLATLLAQPDARGLVRGGEGFGALWLRPEGEELALTARVGRAGTPAAIVALARATHARAVLLCGPGADDACEEARVQLARRWPLLSVVDGPQTALRVSGRLPGPLRTGDLAGVLGPLPIEPAEDGLVLVWSDAARLRAAALGVGDDPARVNEGARVELEPAATAWSPAEQRVLVDELLATWMAWRRREPWAEDGLRVAAGMARVLGLELRQSEDLATLTGPGVRVLLDRRGGPQVVMSEPEERTSGVARALWSRLGATALVEDAPTELAPSHYGADRAAQAVLVGLLRELGPTTGVVTVRALRDTRDAGADVVLSDGEPELRPEAVPDLVARVRAEFAHPGLTVAAHDGTVDRAFLVDVGNVGRTVTRAATGGPTQITAYVGSRARDALAPPEPLGDRAWWWDSLPRVRFDARAPLQPVGPERRAELDAAAGFVTRNDPSALARFRAAARGGEVVLLVDDVLGARWLGVRRGQEVLVAPLVWGATAVDDGLRGAP